MRKYYSFLKYRSHIINIHNANNELAWREVLKWEA